MIADDQLAELVQVPPHDLPQHLLEQKPGLDVEAFRAFSKENPTVFAAFLGREEIDGEEIAVCCFVLSMNPLDKSIFAETVIIDEPYRNDDRLVLWLRILLRTAAHFGQQFGADKVVSRTPIALAKKELRLLGESDGVKVFEWCTGIDLPRTHNPDLGDPYGPNQDSPSETEGSDRSESLVPDNVETVWDVQVMKPLTEESAPE